MSKREVEYTRGLLTDRAQLDEAELVGEGRPAWLAASGRPLGVVRIKGWSTGTTHLSYIDELRWAGGRRVMLWPVCSMKASGAREQGLYARVSAPVKRMCEDCLNAAGI